MIFTNHLSAVLNYCLWDAIGGGEDGAPGGEWVPGRVTITATGGVGGGGGRLKEGDPEDEHEEGGDASSQWHCDNPGDDNIPAENKCHQLALH